MSPIEAAWGILRVLATNVMVAMRTITVERGYDPREFTLVPFGGMGPTDRRPDRGRARHRPHSDAARSRRLQRLWHAGDRRRAGRAASPASRRSTKQARRTSTRSFADMEAAALDDLMREGFARERLVTRAPRRHALPRPVLRGECAGGGAAQRGRSCTLEQHFHEAHHRRYGHMAQDEAMEIVNFSVTAVGLIPKPELKAFDSPAKRKRLPCPSRRAPRISMAMRPNACRCSGATACSRECGSTVPPLSRKRRRRPSSIRGSAPKSTATATSRSRSEPA